MLIVEEYGKDMMIFGVKEGDIKNFENWLDKTTFSGCTGISKYSVPKNNSITNVYIISCDVANGRDDIIDYWENRGIKIVSNN